MADEQNTEQAPKGKKNLLLIIIVAVVVLLAAGGAAFFMMGSSDAATDKAAEAPAKVPVQEQVSYVSVAQPFVFNVTGDKRDRMVQIRVQLMVRGTDNDSMARYHSPLIESTLLSTFAAATVEQLRSPDGRSELREKATEDIRAAMDKAVGKPVVEKVLFTDFVMQ